MSEMVVLETQLEDYPRRRGKVRDVYDLGDRLVIVATDRISAFDWVMPDGITGKGRLLTAMTAFWLGRLGVANHMLSTDLADLPDPFRRRPEVYTGRSMLVRMLKRSDASTATANHSPPTVSEPSRIRLRAVSTFSRSSAVIFKLMQTRSTQVVAFQSDSAHCT